MRRMYSENQLKKLIKDETNNKQDKLTAGNNIFIENNVISTNELTYKCLADADTPYGVEWTETTPEVSVQHTGTLVASEATMNKIYCVLKSEQVAYNRYDKYCTLKVWSEGAGEYIYSWEIL